MGAMNAEEQRLAEAHEGGVPWRRWGPYLSERQWGTVREDYSLDGSAWDSFPHDHARSRAYRWGEDGLLGLSDEKQRLCFALALWNGADPILKERLFGLTNGEGNHGEDVKEYYFYLDSTPTHAYMKALYKYPQLAFPYADLVHTNRQRSRYEQEYELLDTGVFAAGRYFDVFVEYAKATPEDVLIQVTVCNRGPRRRSCTSCPPSGSATPGPPRRGQRGQGRDRGGAAERPRLRAGDGAAGARVIVATHPELGTYHLRCEGSPALLFTENESNTERLYGIPNATPYVKDGFDAYLVQGRQEAVNPEGSGTKGPPTTAWRWAQGRAPPCVCAWPGRRRCRGQ